MIPLSGSDFPSTRGELEDALRGGLAVFQAPRLRIEIDGEPPQLERLHIDLSGAHVPNALPPAGHGGEGALAVRTLELRAQPLRYENAEISLEVNASDARLEFQRDRQNAPLLALTSARDGRIEIAMPRRDLEALVQTIAARAAREHGVTIERTTLRLDSASSRGVDFAAEVIAQKLFMKTVIRLQGRLEIDEQLNARLAQIECAGSGVIGSLGCNFLRPYFAQFQQQSFPLAAFALGGLRVVDVALDTGEPLRVTARLGS